ncbi:MAG TPA: GNAT family N-acetyltransferase, partial [Candidatus Limnocylindrales bacterium]|nr:GNAT family N-acetyltransferase [Candidatus Limnocylindrales bacterium]
TLTDLPGMSLAVEVRVLTDGRITLRPTEPRDLGAIDAGAQDPDVIRWIGPAWPIDEVFDRLDELRLKGSPTWAITEADGSCRGLVWLNVPGDEPKTRYVGYWLLPSARGRGLASDAVRLVATWATQELGVQRLRLATAPDNERSRRVAERNGFRRIPQSEYRSIDRPTDFIFELPRDDG